MITQTLDMKFIRYLNLFEKITGVRCKNCFFYNKFIMFAVPSVLVSKAVGEGGRNVKRLFLLMRMRIKIIALPKSIEEAEEFISSITTPIEFRNLEVTQDEIIISANRQSKAILIGRNKVRLLELEKIVKDFFGKNLRIV